MKGIMLIIGIASFLIALTQFVRGVRVHLCLRKLDLALSRQSLLEELDILRDLEAQVQMYFHPLMMERFAEIVSVKEMQSFQDKLENYQKNVAATFEFREMILDGSANTRYLHKLIDTHIVAGKNLCMFLSDALPASLKP